MRIGIDARAAAEERGGRGTVVRELLSHLGDSPHEILPYARRPWGDVSDRWQLYTAPDPLWHLKAARHANRTCHAFVSTNSYLTVWFLGVPSVMVVCDLVAFMPEYEPQRRAGIIERATLPFAVRRADAIAAISSATAQDLARRFPRAGAKTHVTPLAADARFADPGPPVTPRERPYVLGVGTLEPRKNLPRLINAFAELPDALTSEFDLVLVGGSGWDTDETMRAIRAHSFVHAPGHVSDEELLDLYRGATLFAYPSLYEGFGLPVLEAMAAGVPVLTSNLSSLPEVAGTAALYVDPTSVASIGAGLRRVLTEPALREQLAHAGRIRASRFSWERFTSEILEIVESARLHRDGATEVSPAGSGGPSS